jgi:uncharacterized protein YecE (DUF72 family)
MNLFQFRFWRLFPRLAVGPLAYVRLHGAEDKYRGRYPQSVMRTWSKWMELQLRTGKDLHVYFNNDAEARAPHDALRLRRMIRFAGLTKMH